MARMSNCSLRIRILLLLFPIHDSVIYVDVPLFHPGCRVGIPSSWCHHRPRFSGDTCDVDLEARSSRPDKGDFRPYGLEPVIGVPRTREQRKALLRDTIGGFFFRHTVFRKYPYESSSIALVRGCVAIIAVTCLSLYALDLLVVMPTVESAFLPVRVSTGMPLWQDYEHSLGINRIDRIIFDRPVLSDIAFVY
ncbi:hypothetical protein JAAARDRAFT_215989 [Jaapia argillacea MUCL 33604]|uniref:Uncharacterized protein n=1 Tax=Jaapia argillacea MUCL 33604 TaxID=933084 RepID=A0A067QN81_9AGAM|nr:hypothetical protein JAAARDRAFT_215989 [Jaapia argillacea MUCL 33604]